MSFPYLKNNEIEHFDGDHPAFLDRKWDELPRYIIMHDTQVMERSRHKNDRTWRLFARASSVRRAELILRLLRAHDPEHRVGGLN